VIIETNGSISGQRAAARPLFAFLWPKERARRREFAASPSGRVSPWRVRGRSAVLRRRSRWHPTRATCGSGGAHRRASYPPSLSLALLLFIFSRLADDGGGRIKSQDLLLY